MAEEEKNAPADADGPTEKEEKATENGDAATGDDDASPSPSAEKSVDAAAAAAAEAAAAGDGNAPPESAENTNEEEEEEPGRGSSSDLGAKFEEVASDDAQALKAKAVAAAGGRDPVLQEICMRLECCSCSNPVPPPIQQCKNGHLICPVCLIDVKKSKKPSCPSCSVDMKEPVMNFALAQIAKNTVVPCRFENCNIKCKHPDLDRHLQHCMLKRMGHMVTKDAWKGDDTEKPEDGAAAIAEVVKQLQCSFCAEPAPKPVMQCQNGHVACGLCLDRMRTSGNPICPFCLTSVKETARNIHLEEMAIHCMVNCRFDGCEFATGETLRYPDLADHLNTCEHQPIECMTCPVKSKMIAKFASWDAMWDHYKEKHIGNATQTPLSNMVLKPGHIANMLAGKFYFITWGHSLDDEGNAVRIFPGMYYSKQRETFYFTIRIMAPLGKECYGLTVTSPTSSVMMIGSFPAISYRMPHKYTVNTPCLAISVATMRLMTEGGEGIRFQIALPDDGPSLS